MGFDEWRECEAMKAQAERQRPGVKSATYRSWGENII